MSTSSSPSRARSLLHVMPRPRLTVVPPAVRRPSRLSFVGLLVGVLAVGLVGLLLLNTSMERRTFTLTSMRDESAALALREQTLQMEVANLEQPQAVAARAARLGMVPDPGNAFLDLTTGAVRGYSAAGVAGTQMQVGDVSVPRVHVLGKVMPTVAGQRDTGRLDPLTVVVPPVGGTTTGTHSGHGHKSAAGTTGR